MSRASIIEEIKKERQRQVSREGWSKGHDDDHGAGVLATAAAGYARRAFSPKSNVAPTFWPWTEDWWKPKTPKRNLIRAAALIVAELERLERSEKK